MDDLSPFCLKLKGYLKLAGVAYKAPPFDPACLQKAPKGKLPFVALKGGRLMSDSGMIIDHLIAEGACDLDNGLSAVQKATSLAYRRLLEENLYWILLYTRWKDEPGWHIMKQLFFESMPVLLKQIVAKYQQTHMWNKLKAHGMGLHNREEIYEIGRKDIQALSTLLGDQTHCFGAKKPTLLDITLYAFTANILNPPIENPLKAAVKDKTNLVAHCNHMHSLVGQPVGG